MNTDFALIENFKKLMRIGMLYAKSAHDYVFDESVNDMVAVAYLNTASAKFSAAEALYYSHLDGLEHQDAEEIFHLFDVFMHELLENVRTDHSHQWTSIEYEKLKDAFEHSVFASVRS